MKSELEYFKSVLGSHWDCLAENAKEVQKIENKYVSEFKRVFKKIADQSLDKKTPNLDELEDLLIRHMFETMIFSYEYTETEKEIIGNPKKRFAKPPPTKFPRNIKDLMKMYDKYRKKGSTNSGLADRAKELAESLKKQYLKRLETIYKRYGAKWQGNAYEFGDMTAKERATKAIKKAAETTYSRSKMIVETETSNYVNSARKEIYDQSPAVTAYLLLAVRDAATTKWCNSRNGKWFKKGSEVEKVMTPPLHPYCRSEILPLSPLNPAHKRILADKSRDASKSKLEPLIKGWGSRR